MYCENDPVGLLRTPYHGYFSLRSANHVLLRRFPSLCNPIDKRTFVRGGVNVPVTHPQEAGERDHRKS